MDSTLVTQLQKLNSNRDPTSVPAAVVKSYVKLACVAEAMDAQEDLAIKRVLEGKDVKMTMSDCAKRYPKQLSKKSPERKLCESTVRNRDVDLTPLACQLIDPSVSDFHKIPTRVHSTMTRHLALSLVALRGDKEAVRMEALKSSRFILAFAAVDPVKAHQALVNAPVDGIRDVLQALRKSLGARKWFSSLESAADVRKGFLDIVLQLKTVLKQELMDVRRVKTAVASLGKAIPSACGALSLLIDDKYLTKTQQTGGWRVPSLLKNVKFLVGFLVRFLLSLVLFVFGAILIVPCMFCVTLWRPSPGVDIPKGRSVDIYLAALRLFPVCVDSLMLGGTTGTVLVKLWVDFWYNTKSALQREPHLPSYKITLGLKSDSEHSDIAIDHAYQEASSRKFSDRMGFSQHVALKQARDALLSENQYKENCRTLYARLPTWFRSERRTKSELR